MTAPIPRSGRLALSDLDGTLIGSPRMARANGGTTATLVEVERIEERPAAHLTAAAGEAVAALTAVGRLVPVTTRTAAQYRRIRLPGPTPPVALCANGAVLLVDGVEDATHAAHVQQVLAALEASPEQVASRIRRDHGTALGTARVHVADGYFCYVVFDDVAHVEQGRAVLAALAADLGWAFSVQGRKCYLVPALLTKGRAAARVCERFGWDDVVAAGDAILDLDLLHHAGAAVIPAHSELLEPRNLKDHRLPAGVVVTGTRGLDGTAEIAQWLRTQVLPG